jgi:hypothetical protein
MANDGNPPDKKDLTGILDLPQLDPVGDDGASVPEDPFAVNELQPIEAIDTFESIDQIGMMDHEPPPEEPPPSQELSAEQLPTDTLPGQDPFEAMATDQGLPAMDVGPSDLPDPFAPVESTVPAPAPPMDFLEEFPAAPVATVAPLEPIRSYAEKVKEAPFTPGTRFPHHLLVSGEFDLFARDKLLLFITENDVGISSSELDFQISAGRVLFSRISEFSGIKLIQDMRDSGLEFILKPSPRDPDELTPESPSSRFHFEVSKSDSRAEVKIPVLPAGAAKEAGYVIYDSIRMVQYLRAEMLEVEKSDLFQELIERMTEALKRRARLKGAEALGSLEHKITPLRLPSQYEVELSASLLKKGLSG